MADESVVWSLDADGEGTLAVLDEIDAALSTLSDSIAATAESAGNLTAVDDALTAIQEQTDVAASSTDMLMEAMSALTDQVGILAGSVDLLAGSLDATAASAGGAAAGADTAATSIEGTAAAADGAALSLEGLQTAMGPLMMIGTMATLVGGKFVSMGLDGQKGGALLRGMAGASQSDIQALQVDAVNLGVGMDQASQGFYQVESAGYAGSQAISVFDAATRLAEGGQASEADVLSSLTAIMHDYNAKASDATHYTDLMGMAVVRGKQSMSDFASSIGPLASAGENVGLSFQEVAASEATMTQINPHVRQDAQQLTSLFKTLSPTMGTVAGSAKKLGLSFDEAHYKSLDLLGKLHYLADIAGGTNTAAFAKLTGGVQGSTAAIDLLKDHADAFRGNLDAMGHAAGTTANTFAQYEDTIPAHLDKAGAALSVFGTKLMDAIGPKVTPLIDDVSGGISKLADLILNHTDEVMPVLAGLAGMIGGALVLAIIAFISAAWPVLAILTAIGLVVAGVTYTWQHWSEITTSVADFFRSKWEGLSSWFLGIMSDVRGGLTAVGDTVSGVISGVLHWFDQWRGVILGVATALGVFFGPALIKAGAEAVTSGAKIAAEFVANLVKTGTEATVNGVKLGVSFVQTMIKTGTEAVISGSKLAVSFIANMVKSGVEAVVNGAKITGQFVASLVKTGVEGWQSAGKLALFIGSLVKSGVEAAAAGIKIAASFVANLAKAGIEAAMAGAKIAAEFIATLVKTGIQAAITGGTMLASLVPAIASVVAEALVAAATAIPGLVMGFGAWAISAGAAAVATIAATWPILLIVAAIGLLIGIIVLLVTHWGQVVTFLRGVWQGFTSWLMGALHAIGQFFVGIWDGIISFLRQAWNVIVTIAKVALVVLLAVILGPIGLLVLFIMQHWKQIQDIFTDGWNYVKALFVAATVIVINTVTGFVQNVVHWFENLWHGAQDKINELFKWLDSLFGGLPGKALKWGEDMLSGFVQGIKNGIGAVGQAIGNLAGSIRSALHFSVPDEGPLADADQWMPDMVSLLAKGVTDNQRKLKDAVHGMAAEAAQGIGAPTINANFSSTGGGALAPLGGSAALPLLAGILAAIQQNKPGAPAQPPSVTMYNQNALYGMTNIADLYNSLNALAGYSFENGARGAL